MEQPVYLFVFDGLSDWEHGFAVAGINNPQYQRTPGRYVVRTASIGGKTVVTIGGVRIQPDVALETIDPAAGAMLILPGGNAWDEGANTEAVRKAREFLQAGKPIAAICGATAGLARGRLLDDVAHTSNAREYLQMTGYKGGRHYRDEPAVVDQNIITASAMAPLEFARAIFSVLDLYSDDVLDAWYALFSTRNPEHFGRLMAATQASSTAAAGQQ